MLVSQVSSTKRKRRDTYTSQGAVISLSAPEEGDNVWKAEQIDVVRNLPPGDIEGRIPIDWSFGPIKVCRNLSFKFAQD